MLTINQLFCLRLHTAGVLIGWLGGALSAVKIIISAVVLGNIDEVVKYIIQQDENKISPDGLKTALTILLSIYLLLAVVNLTASVLLVAGTMKERHLMIVPWLINNGIELFGSFLSLVLMMYAYIANGDSFGSILGMTIVWVLAFGFQYLIWTAIYSLFRNIRAARENQQLIPNNAGQAYPSYTRI